jgi:hypothetical protein
MSKPEDIKPVERAKKEWEAMEQEIETKAHELVVNTPVEPKKIRKKKRINAAAGGFPGPLPAPRRSFVDTSGLPRA